MTQMNPQFVTDNCELLYSKYWGYKDSWEYRFKLLYADCVQLGRKKPMQNTAVDVNSGFKIMTLGSNYTVDQSCPSLSRHADLAIRTFAKHNKIWRKDGKPTPPEMPLSAIDPSDYLNELKLRVSDFSKHNLPSSGGEVSIVTQPCRYFEQVATNLTCDWCSGAIDGDPNATIRTMLEPPTPEGKLVSLAESLLANTLGVAAMVYTRDHRFFIRIRSNKDLAVMTKGQFHCSVSGAASWKVIHSNVVNGIVTFRILSEALCAEVLTELGLEKNEYDIEPLAFARELPRCGKPQLFYLIRVHYTLAELRRLVQEREDERLRATTEQSVHPESKLEFLDFEDLPKSSEVRNYARILDAPGSDPLLNSPEIRNAFTYEGWAAYRYARLAVGGDEG